MATITGLTAERMLSIEGASVVSGEIVGTDLILTQYDGSTINAGQVVGPTGPTGPTGPPGAAAISSIPGEIKLWPDDTLPVQGTYGKWVWADGAAYPIATYPIASGHIATQWRTAHGAADPGGTNFRVPDLRGLTPVGLDAMPGGARANRMTRSVAITLAGRTGEETHIVTVAEMPAHAHGITDPGHDHAQLNANIMGHYAAGSTSQSYVISDDTGVDRHITYINDLIAGSGSNISIQNNGGGGAHENVQPTVFVPYIVRLDG